MTINYYVDNVQLFKGFLIIEGWAFSGVLPVRTALSYRGSPVACQQATTNRPDVSGRFADAPAQIGFILRAIVSNIDKPEEIVLVLATTEEEVRLTRPGEIAYHTMYKPLGALSGRFFDCVKSANDGFALEVGGRARSGIVRRELFGDKVKYIAFDIVDGPNVDVVGDAHELTRHFPANMFDFCYSASVFEHLMWPWKVALEMNAVMKPGGLAFVQSHPTWPKHEIPWDFFRFWDSGWRALFCKATGFRVLDTVEAHVVDLIPRQYIGNTNLHWEGDYATLASAVLAEKTGDPTVAWTASPPLDEFGKYPF